MFVFPPFFPSRDNKKNAISRSNRFLDLLILLCVYIGFISFPYLWAKGETTGYSLLAFDVARVLFIACLFLFPLDDYRAPKKSFWPLLPFFLLAFSNLLSLAFDQSGLDLSSSKTMIIDYAFYFLFLSYAEERIFRTGFYSFFRNKNGALFSIFGSALIFSLSHLANIFGGNIFPVLLQVAYTFGLGLVLGLIYEKSGFFLAFLFHFVFDFLNDGVFVVLHKGDWTLSFYLVNSILAILLALYGLFLITKVFHVKLSFKGKD